jgi:small-conductance mechanosensitive channel
MKQIVFILLLSMLAVCRPSNAQISKIAENILGVKQEVASEVKNDSVSKSDSVRIADLTMQIQQMKLNEIVYLNELEEFRSTTLSDSIRKAQRKARIDSLRKVTPGAPVIIDDQKLYTFYTARGGVSINDRAGNTERKIQELGKTWSVKPDSIYLLRFEDGNQIDIMYGGKVITSVIHDDALWMDTNIDSLAETQRAMIIEAVKSLQKKHSLLQVLKRIGLFVLVIAIQAGLIFATNKLYRKSKRRIIRKARSKFKPVVIRNYEFLTVKREIRMLIFAYNILRYVLILIQLLITIPILFSIFPHTKDLAMIIFGYILTPVKSIFAAIVTYIPNLFYIVAIYYSIKYLIKGVNFLANEIQNERLKIPGFYPDWAIPTYHIIRFLLYAFMIAMIYQYLPGSSSGVFQSISVFVGLIISLGSTAFIGNIIAGLVITYMRPFSIGDRIKLNDTTGNVVEKSLFVTRIKTPKNEIITIPNSFILSSQTTNYSVSAKNYGLIVHSDVSIGYEVPWQKAHECLLKAAKATTGIIRDKAPFVLDLGLENYYNLYQINVYIADANKIPVVITELNSRIQDIFLEEGIDIESPILISERGESAKH